MSDKIEQVPLGHLQGMARPEEYLWDTEADGPPSLDELPADPGLPEESVLPEPKEKVKARSLRSIIPQKDKNADAHAQLTEPLSPGDLALLMNNLKAQPILFQEARNIENRSRSARVWGYAVGLLISAFLMWRYVPDYIQALKDPKSFRLPESIRDSVPQDAIDKAKDIQLGEVVTLMGGAVIILIAILSICLTLILILRALFLKKPFLAGAAALNAFAAIVLWKAIMDESMTPWTAFAFAAGALIISSLYEGVLRKVRRG